MCVKTLSVDRENKTRDSLDWEKFNGKCNKTDRAMNQSAEFSHVLYVFLSPFGSQVRKQASPKLSCPPTDCIVVQVDLNMRSFRANEKRKRDRRMH